ncbi:MAG: succinate dehydrogenase cytochrome b subunit, partial [Muribaculaceae bacterium]|nr:succinate dehydrogenase cytochrome b subunit [Muribaculaceae bacterium]
LIWPTAYNLVCEFLGANWYALIASAGLAALFIIHIIYACWLTIQNRRARGNDRYLVNTRPPQVEWSSKNMLVLGIVILAFLVVHLIQFWHKMQWQELMHHELSVLPQLNGAPVPPSFGTLFIQMAFSEVWTPIVYIIGFIALWFHMNHGFWSMLHSVGWDNGIWLNRLKAIGCWWTSIVVALFIAQAIVFTVRSHQHYYSTNIELQEQYSEFWKEKSQAIIEDFQASAQKEFANANPSDPMIEAKQAEFFLAKAPGYIAQATAVINSVEKQCPDLKSETLGQLEQFKQFLEQNLQNAENQAK